MMAPGPLAARLQEQIRQVDERVSRGGGTYRHEAEEIRVAAGIVDDLAARLQLRELVGNLNPGTGKPQLLLEFRDERDLPVVLKIYGRRRPNEAAVQALWANAGVATAPVLAAGDEPVSWLLMPRLPGRPPPAATGPDLTGQVAALMAAAHQVPYKEVGEPRDLYTGLSVHLHGVLRSAAAHGYPVPPNIDASAMSLMRAGRPTYLHGDLTPVNLLQHEGSLWVLDTAGYTGPGEFDAARWSARVGGSERAEECLDRWLTVERELDLELAHHLLALELYMEAGVREIVKDERGIDPAPRDPETLALLDAGERLLAQ